MNKRKLGKNGFTIGEVGLGCWQFGGEFGEMSEETAFEIMNTAVESGVDFFDTADVYGAGISEELIGRFAQQCATPLILATKYGRWEGVFPDNYTKDNMRQAIDLALGRLQRRNAKGGGGGGGGSRRAEKGCVAASTHVVQSLRSKMLLLPAPLLLE